MDPSSSISAQRAFLVLIGLAAASLASCSSAPAERDMNYYRAGTFDYRQVPGAVPSESESLRRMQEEDQRASLEFQSMRSGEQRAAYEQGIKDTITEFRGRMQGRAAFVYEPPMIEYVQMPTQVVNGALIPAHEEPVIISAGRWVEENNVGRPTSNVYQKPEGRAEPAPPPSPRKRIQYVPTRSAN